MGGRLSFKAFLAEGGNIKVGEVGANAMDMAKVPRANRQKDVSDLMHGINHDFMATHGDHLFGRKGEGIDSGGIFAGSSKAFMDKNLKDEEHNKYKPSVGDIDTMYPEHHKEKLGELLQPGKRYGRYSVVGIKKNGSQFSGLFKHDNGEVHQVDFEPQPFENGEPNKWAQFSHSSDFNDVKTGLKGVHHKLLLSALTAAHGRQGIIRGPKGDQPGFVEDNAFAVAGGLRPRHKEVEGEKGVYQELKPADTKYEQDVPKIFKTMIGHDANDEELGKFGNFHGVLDLASKHFSKEQQSRVADKFIHNLYDPRRAQMMNKDPKKDMEMKENALNFLRKKFKHHFTPDLEKELDGRRKEFYDKIKEREGAKADLEKRRLASQPKKKK